MTPHASTSAPVDRNLPNINGRIDSAYVVVEQDGPAVSTFAASDTSDWVLFTLEYSYNLSGGARHIAMEIVECYEDGFAYFRQTLPLEARSEYIGGNESGFR